MIFFFLIHSTILMSDSENFQPGKLAVEFGSFLQSQNILGLAIGFLIASSTLDTSKALVSSVIMPLVEGLQGLDVPQFDLYPLLESIVTFIVTMFIAFVILRVAKVQNKQIQLVQVVN